MSCVLFSIVELIGLWVHAILNLIQHFLIVVLVLKTSYMCVICRISFHILDVRLLKKWS